MSDIIDEDDDLSAGDPFDPNVVMKADEVARSTAQVSDEKAYAYIQSRASAYRRVFAGKGSPDDAHLVMLDLMTFCRAAESTFHPDPRIAAQLDGRREVYLRIADHIHLDQDTLYVKYNQRHNPTI